MANPQPIPFVQFSKELYDAILAAPMPGCHKEIVLAIVRRTYGDGGRKEAPVSYGLLKEMTGRNRGHIQRALGDLRAAGVVTVVREARFTDPQVLALNKDYEAWGQYAPQRTVRAEATGREEETVQAAPAQQACTHGSNRPVRARATIEDKSIQRAEELKDSSPKRPVVSAPTDTDWKARADALLNASHFPSDLMQLGEQLAASNKTGKASLSRIVREIYEPLVALQDELPDAAIRHGLRAAITKGAPNANYVAKAARGYRGNGNAPATNSYADELTDEDRDFFTVTER